MKSNALHLLFSICLLQTKEVTIDVGLEHAFEESGLGT